MDGDRHPVTDICDYYADIDMGLGKGVWTKETVPQGKAHPHCMCLLIPRVTKIRQRGSGNYGEFLNRLPEEKRNELLPDWLRNLNQLGMPMDKMVRPDGLGPVTREMMKGRLGAPRFDALSAVSRAHADKDYGMKDLTRDKRRTRRMLAYLEPLRAQNAEVERFLKQVEAHPERIESRLQHYIKRRYIDRVWDRSIGQFDALFADTVGDSGATIHRKGDVRYQIRSARTGWIAIVEPNGRRVSLFPDNNDDLGEPLWTLRDLL